MSNKLSTKHVTSNNLTLGKFLFFNNTIFPTGC